MSNILKKCNQVFSLRKNLAEHFNDYFLANPPPAIIISGEKGCGKSEVALALSYALLLNFKSLKDFSVSEDAVEESLKSQLRYLENFCHPDLINLDYSDKKVLKIGDLREAVENETNMAPQFADRKIWLIDLDCLNEQSQNTLLKTLEQPAEASHFILMCKDYTEILSTISSRCQKYSLQNLNKNESRLLLLDILAEPQVYLQRKFLEQYDNWLKDKADSEHCTSLNENLQKLSFILSKGNPAKLLSLYFDLKYRRLRQQLFKYLLVYQKLDLKIILLDICHLAEEICAENYDFPAILLSWLNDLILIKTASKLSDINILKNEINNPDFITYLLKQVEDLKLSSEHLLLIRKETDIYLQALNTNMPKEISLSALFLYLRLNLR